MIKRQWTWTATNVLLTLQIIVGIITLFPMGRLYVYALGLKDVAAIARAGQYWRLVTPMFIHFGFEHLLFNSITLYFLGNQVEMIIGAKRFLALYFLSGVMGNLFSYQFSMNYSAGASTALFGLFAYFVAMDYLEPQNPYYQAMGQQYKLLLVFNIVANVFMSGIDMWGHIGGIVGGLLGTVIINAHYRRNNRQYFWLGIGAYVLVATIIILNHGIL
ncbi:MAG: rhomboid family intramembrane serine protease [Aerococcus sp.]|nr:rhomboid family intramembrane serine protease [Aerococcus sp.]